MFVIKIFLEVALLGVLFWASYTDLKTGEISNTVAPWVMTLSFGIMPSLTLADRWFGFVVCFLPVLMVSIAMPKGLGGGDVKLLGAFGFALGAWDGIIVQLIAMCLSLAGCLIWNAVAKKSVTRPIAPFLCGAFFIFQLCLVLFKE
jgi:leader peptidase (prepilin peptidase)/N-methyltransferase